MNPFEACALPDYEPMRVLFPEGADPRVVEAAHHLAHRGLAFPILLGDTDEIERAARGVGVDLGGVEVINPEESTEFDDYAVEFADRRDIPLHTARCMTTVPFYFAAMMLCSGDADALVAGTACSTQEILMATDLVIGTRDDAPTPSSFAVLEIPGRDGAPSRLLAVADCAVNPRPTARQLADIAVSTADSVESLLDWPVRVALLSHSTHGHPLEPHTEQVCEAVDIVRRRVPGLLIDGELQLDAALDPHVARRKMPLTGAVAGRANVLIFPDLNAASIAVKMAHHFAGATVCGPILQGFSKTVGLLSRSATTCDVIGTAILSCAQAAAQKRPQPRTMSLADGATTRSSPRWGDNVITLEL